MVKRKPQEDIVKYPMLKRLCGLGLTNVKWHPPGPFVERDKGTGSSRKKNKKNPYQEPVRGITHRLKRTRAKQMIHTYCFREMKGDGF